MSALSGHLDFINVTPENAEQETFYCIKDIKSPGFKSKQRWFAKRYNEGLRIKILKIEDKMIGFIEYVPANKAWRPIEAPEFMFIHCLMVGSKKDREEGSGSLLIKEVEKEAKARNLKGLCVMSSKGPWMAAKQIFENNGFIEVDKKDRYKLLSKKWDSNTPDPKFINWTKNQNQYKGWHLVYADQCPWHEKSAFDLMNTALDYDIDLKLKKLETAQQAKNAPSGFGVFSLLLDGTLLEDHYISATRFKNILKKQLKK
ncbi:MAG: GNAT family N-acetyltransferase [Flavobacteriaceae bacterium]|nr:GNAT family N-acetyltransferase [Flavobacteriaceae bacterium]